MLVLYQLLLKYTKCQYGELTVSLLFSAQRKHETKIILASDENYLTRKFLQTKISLPTVQREYAEDLLAATCLIRPF